MSFSVLVLTLIMIILMGFIFVNVQNFCAPANFKSLTLTFPFKGKGEINVYFYRENLP